MGIRKTWNDIYTDLQLVPDLLEEAKYRITRDLIIQVIKHEGAEPLTAETEASSVQKRLYSCTRLKKMMRTGLSLRRHLPLYLAWVSLLSHLFSRLEKETWAALFFRR